MSRVAKNPVAVPGGVEVKLQPGKVNVKGPKGQLEQGLHPLVTVKQEGNLLKVERKIRWQSRAVWR